jgi:hypothetical protein
MLSPIHFPNLSGTNHQITSPKTWEYNCIGWAANDEGRWWWPFGSVNDTEAYWPPNVTKSLSEESFIAAFATLGYSVAMNGELEHGKEKVVLYTDEQGKPTHMARQLNNGQWTSKLGPNHDISHIAPDVVCGPSYGKVSVFLERNTISVVV